MILENSGIAAVPYHAISSSLYAADTMSMYPSLSISATKTDNALSTLVSTLTVVQPASGVPSFSCPVGQAIPVSQAITIR